MKRIMKLFLAITIAIILTIGGGYAYYYFVGSTPKNNFAYIIKKELNTLMNERILNAEKQYMQMNIIPSKEATNIDASLNIRIDTDNTNNTFANTNTLTYNGKKALTFNIYGKNKKIYLESKELYSKIVYADIEQTESINYQELSTIIKKIGILAIKNIPDEKFVKETEKITFEAKSYDTTKYTLTISGKEIGNTINATIDDILKDKDLMNRILNIYKVSDKNKTLEILKKDLEELKNSNKETYTSDDKTIISIYKNKNILALKLFDNDKNEQLSMYKKDGKYIAYLSSQAKMTITVKNNQNAVIYGIDLSSINNEQTTSILAISIEVGTSSNVSIPNIDSAQKYDGLTEDNKSEIMNNLTKIELVQSLLSMFQTDAISSNLESDAIEETEQHTYEFDENGTVIEDNRTQDFSW